MKVLLVTGALLFVAVPLGVSQGSKDDTTLIQGTWRVESCKDSGRNDAVIEGLLLSFLKGGKLIATKGEKVVEGVFRLDPSKHPKCIDIDLGYGAINGIYDLNGDSLKICHGNPGESRATDFVSDASAPNRILAFLKRHKDKGPNR